MKLRDTQSISILIQFGDFKSIDLFQRGYYQIKARLYSKYRAASSGLRRIDATISNHHSEVNQNSRAIRISPETCTLPHSICNWRCRQGQTNTGDKIPTSWLSEIVFVEHADACFSLNESILFKYEQSCKLYPSEYHQTDDLFLDFELFFHEKKSVKDGLLEGPSKQRMILFVPGISKLAQLRQLYHQLQFSGIYSASLDIFATQMLVESRLILKNDGNQSEMNGGQVLNPIMTFISSKKKLLQERFTDLDSESTSDFSEEEKQRHCNQPEDAIIIQMKWLLLIFENLQNLPQTDEMPFLSRYQLLNDICLPWKDLVQSDEVEIIPDLLSKKEILMEALRKYLQNCDLSLEYGQNILSSLGTVCSNGANDVLKYYTRYSFENMVAFRRKVYIDMMAASEQYCVTKREVVFLKTPLQFDNILKDNSSKFESEITQYSPQVPKLAWLIEITKETPLRENFREQHVAAPGAHLIVFVHGLLGHANDLRKIKVKIEQNLNNDFNADTEFIYLFSKSNQSNTFDHLITMGSNLADEVGEYVQNLGIEQIRNISFVGHSLGGLIIRVAIRNEKLQKLKHLFHGLITFGTPHLSQALNNHMVLSAALRLYQSIYSAACVDQLYLNDHEDKRECLLYRLSQDSNLQAFKKVYVFGSEQDQYVHFEGALLSPLCNYKDYSIFDQSLQPIYREMQRNMLSNCQSLERFQLHFEEVDLVKKKWGYMGDPLGRNAHIALILNENAIQLALLKTFFSPRK